MKIKELKDWMSQCKPNNIVTLKDTLEEYKGILIIENTELKEVCMLSFNTEGIYEFNNIPCDKFKWCPIESLELENMDFYDPSRIFIPKIEYGDSIRMENLGKEYLDILNNMAKNHMTVTVYDSEEVYLELLSTVTKESHFAGLNVNKLFAIKDYPNSDEILRIPRFSDPYLRNLTQEDNILNISESLIFQPYLYNAASGTIPTEFVSLVCELTSYVSYIRRLKETKYNIEKDMKIIEEVMENYKGNIARINSIEDVIIK